VARVALVILLVAAAGAIGYFVGLSGDDGSPESSVESTSGIDYGRGFGAPSDEDLRKQFGVEDEDELRERFGLPSE
jgi:hypothetical protein